MAHSCKVVVMVCCFYGIMLLFSGIAHARTDMPAVLIDRDAALAAAQEITVTAYPDADSVLVDEHTWIRYEMDGTYVQHDESYRKVLTQEGVGSLKSLSSWFTFPYNTTRFVLVEVIRPDGSVIPVDVAANSREMIERDQMDANIYNPNDKILNVNLPELRKGDVVHYLLEDIFSKVRTPGSFSDLIMFESMSPILHKKYTILAPKGLPLKRTALRDQVGDTVVYTSQKVEDRIMYTWEGSNIPQAFAEPDMPSFHTVGQRVLVSTIPDWEWISRWYWDLSRPHLEKITPEMKEKVASLTRGITDPNEQIHAIFTWVSQEIRYLGLTLETTAPGYEPHSVDMTFERRAGVCRDKAALLVAMLRIAEFDAYPVLIMSGPKKDPEVAQPFFNHAISAVHLADGTYVLMDSTDEHTRDLFPPYLNNCSYLVATPAGDPLRTSPILPAKDNLLKIRTTAQLDAHGEMKGVTHLGFFGINDSAYRGFFARSPKEKQRTYFEKTLKRAFPGAVLSAMEVLPENVMDTTTPLTVRLNFTVPRAMVAGEEAVMLPVPAMGEHLGVARMLIDKMGLEERRYPLFTKYACGVEEELRLELGSGMGVLRSSPAPVRQNEEAMTFMQSFEMGDNVLVARRLFTMNLPEYGPSQYLLLKKALEERQKDLRAVCIFAAQTDKEDPLSWYGAFSADAVILDQDVAYRVTDEHSWVREEHVRKKILTYAGKKENSELVIDYTPAWEDVRIAHAEVIGANGSVKTIEPQEINRMDADWVGEAPRYPVSKTLVASLPGVEEGSILDYTIVHTMHDRSFFSMMESVASKYPVVKTDVRVSLPQGLDVRVLASDQGWGLESLWVRKPQHILQTTRSVEKGTVTYGFSGSRVAPIVQEKDLPPEYCYQPTVAMTSGTWRGYAQSIYDHLVKQGEVSRSVAHRASLLVEGLASDVEKVQRIRDFVAKHIAQVGPKIGEGPLESIFSADTTLKDGYGNTADTAVLLYTMLTSVGFSPEFVVPANAPAIPVLQEFMHSFVSPLWLEDVLVRVRVAGQDVYLNDTDEYAVLGSTPHDGRPGIVVPGGDIRIIRPAKNMRDRNGFAYDIDLQENGDARITCVHTFWGTEYNSRHKMLAEMSPETSARYQMELAAALSLNAEIETYATAFEEYPGTESITVRVKKFGTRQGDYVYVDLPGMIKGLGGVDGESRINPLYRESGKYGVTHVRVHLPAHTRDIAVLPASTFSIPVGNGGNVQVQATCLPSRDGALGKVPCQTVEVDQHAEVDPMVVPPTAYGVMREAEDILVGEAHGTLMFRLDEHRQ